MTTTEPDILNSEFGDARSEAALLQAVRDGSTAAFGVLYARYRPFAVNLAQRSLAQPDLATAEDVAEIAFIRVFTALGNGKGPADTLRAYLATTVRREVWRAERRTRRQDEVVDLWANDHGRAIELDRSPLPSEASDLGSHALLDEAFRGLSDRWRHVLWLTEVEGRKPAEVAPLLGVSAGTASALAYRARQGLITAYLEAYLRITADAACAANAERLGEYVAAGAPTEGFADVEAHLDGCAGCRDVARGVDVLGSVVASMAPFGLFTTGLWARSAGVGAAGAVAKGAAVAATAKSPATGALASTTSTASAGGLGLGAAAVVGAAAAVLVAGVAWAGLVRRDATPSAARHPAGPVATSTSGVAGPGPSAPAGPVATTQRTGGSTVADPGTSADASTSNPPSTSSSTTPSTSSTGVPSPGLARPADPVTPTTTTVAVSTSTSRPVTTTGPPTSVTTTVPVPANGALAGRAIIADFVLPGIDVPVMGVGVAVYDGAGVLAGEASTGFDGRWRVAGLRQGHYTVVATVPGRYRPAWTVDPWTSEGAWTVTLASVDVADAPLDLVDLRLALR